MLGKNKRLEIANICYANVAGSFAMMCNDKYRGQKFEWKNFPSMMEQESDLWLIINNVKGDRTAIKETAKEFAKEIAETMIKRSGFVKSNT